MFFDVKSDYEKLKKRNRTEGGLSYNRKINAFFKAIFYFVERKLIDDQKFLDF